jgi:hypothetical protein
MRNRRLWLLALVPSIALLAHCGGDDSGGDDSAANGDGGSSDSTTIDGNKIPGDGSTLPDGGVLAKTVRNYIGVNANIGDGRTRRSATRS